MTFTLLITCVGGELAPQTIRQLKASDRHEVTVVGVDASPEAIGRHFCDYFHQTPLGNETGYVAAISDIVDKHSVNLVLPTSDEEAIALSYARSQIESDTCQLACADAELLAIVNDKGRCYRRLEQLGLKVPTWRAVSQHDEIVAAVRVIVDEFGSAVVKPAAERGGRGVCVVRSDLEGLHPYQGGREVHMDKTTFESEYARNLSGSSLIVMERLEEPVFDVDMLAWQGKPVRIVARRRVDSALPNEGHSIVDNPDLLELGDTLIRNLNLSWLYDCDVMYDSKGCPGILEINPRPSGSIATTIAAGVPLLEDLVSLAKGETVEEITIPTGNVVVPYKSLALVS